MSYTVRFSRGNRAWTCSVFELGPDGNAAGQAVASGSGPTKDDARDAAIALSVDTTIREALASSDNSRPYWVQGAFGEQQEALRKTAADETITKKKPRKY